MSEAPHPGSMSGAPGPDSAPTGESALETGPTLTIEDDTSELRPSRSGHERVRRAMRRGLVRLQAAREGRPRLG